MRAPTENQLRLLRFYADHISAGNYLPTLREVRWAFNWSSVHAVTDHLKRLEGKGLIRRPFHKSRALELTSLGWKLSGVRRTTVSPAVKIDLGFRCTSCGTHSFDRSLPCFECAMARLPKPIIYEATP